MAYGYTEFAYWWEPFEMLRRVLLAVALVMAKVAYDQLAVVIILLIIYIVMSFLFAPFNDPYITVLHALTDSTLLFIVVTGLVYSRSDGTNDVATDGLRTNDAATLAVVFVCFCVSVSLLIWSFVFAMEFKQDVAANNKVIVRLKGIFQSTKQNAKLKAENLKAKVLMPEGQVVLHPTRGQGRVTKIDWNDPRQKPYIVSFDNGEVHHYSASSALKLKKVEPPQKGLARTASKLARSASSFKLHSPVEKMGSQQILSSSQSVRKNAIRTQSEFTALGQRAGSPSANSPGTSAPKSPAMAPPASPFAEGSSMANEPAEDAPALQRVTSRGRVLSVFDETHETEEEPKEDDDAATDMPRRVSLASARTSVTSNVSSDPPSCFVGGNGFLAASTAQQSDISFVDDIAADARTGQLRAFSCSECGSDVNLSARSAALLMALACGPMPPANGDGRTMVPTGTETASLPASEADQRPIMSTTMPPWDDAAPR